MRSVELFFDFWCSRFAGPIFTEFLHAIAGCTEFSGVCTAGCTPTYTLHNYYISCNLILLFVCTYVLFIAQSSSSRPAAPTQPRVVDTTERSITISVTEPEVAMGCCSDVWYKVWYKSENDSDYTYMRKFYSYGSGTRRFIVRILGQ